MSAEQSPEQAEYVDRGDELAPTPEAEAEAPSPEQEPTSEPEPTPAASEKPRSEQVPRARFDEVNDRLHEERQARLEIEARLRALEAPKTPPFDLEKAEQDYLEAVTDGDKDKATKIWSQIRYHERQQHEERLTARMQQELEAHKTQVALTAAAETALEKYPFLDHQHADANPVAIQEVVEWRDYYHLVKKMPLAQALKQAVARVAPAYAKATSAAGDSPPTQTDARVQAQRLANAKAAAALPPSTGKMGIGERATRGTPVDVAQMTDQEFESLPAADRARLRGDGLA